MQLCFGKQKSLYGVQVCERHNYGLGMEFFLGEGRSLIQRFDLHLSGQENWDCDLPSPRKKIRMMT